jgi:hypothetical protein|tara:strand:- start:213 stop:374 length:162 start_codon:yes stop_codon:yes gene_type:complete
MVYSFGERVVSDYGKCDICRGKLLLKETKEVSGTMYNILRCGKCNKQIVRNKN